MLFFKNFFKNIFKNKNTTPNVNTQDELYHNYVILQSISKKIFEEIFGNVASVHTHEYIDTLGDYFKQVNKNIITELYYNFVTLGKIPKKNFEEIFGNVASVHTHEYIGYFEQVNRNIINELLENLNINDEIIKNYKILNSSLKNSEENKKWLDDVILAIILIHSKDYVKALQNYANKNNNLLIANKISELQDKGKEFKENEIRPKLVDQYNKLATTLYGGSYKGSVFSAETNFSMLLNKFIIIFGDDELAILCDNIIKDISNRGQNMLEEINNAIENNEEWWYFDENKLFHVNI